MAELAASLAPHLTTVSHHAYRIVPDVPHVDPLDPSYAAKSDSNRWNRLGEPTLYLAGDQRVLAAEWARHLKAGHQIPDQIREMRTRRIFDVHVTVDAVLDLRDARVCALLVLDDAPWCFLRSHSLCQTVASRLRHETPARGILAPSMALLDQLDRWVMVLFVDKLPSYPEPFITSVMPLGVLPATLQASER